MPENPNSCLVAMRFSPENLAQALVILRSAAGPILAKRGCRICRVAQDSTEEGWVHYTEEWDDANAFLRHLKSAEFWPILMVMDLCNQEPEVRIGNLSMKSGIRLLQTLRESESPTNGQYPSDDKRAMKNGKV